MSIELASPEVELDAQEVEEENETTKNIEQEIECPRCYDVMVLSSDFDKLPVFLSRMWAVTCNEINSIHFIFREWCNENKVC